MFLQAYVKNSVYEGVHPSMHWGRHPPTQCMLEYTSPGQTPPVRYLPTATAADGTHPTGKHSCLFVVFTARTRSLL